MPGIAFYRPTSLYGKAISWFTKSEWSHVGIVHDVCGVRVVTQALVKQGVIPVPLTAYQAPDVIVELPWIGEDEATEWLAKRWAAPYSLWDAFGIVRFQLTNAAQKGRSGYICSELAAQFLDFIYRHHRGDLPADFCTKVIHVIIKNSRLVTPRDLAEALL